MEKLEEEKQLYEDLKINFENGFKKLTKKYSKYLLNHCKFTFEMSLMDAEEIVSDVFYKAYKGFSRFSFKGKNSIRNWLFTILINHVRDLMNREGRFKKENEKYYYDESESDNDFDTSNNGAKMVFEQMILGLNVRGDIRKEEIWEALREFTQDEIADIYCYFNCVSYEEIAQQTSSNVDATKKRVSRLIQKLSNKLNDKFNLNDEKIYERIKKAHKEDISGRFAGK